MISINSKALRIGYSIIVGIIVYQIIWANVWRVTGMLGIPSGSILNKLTRDAIVALSVLLFTGIVIRPKEVISFLGLNCNILKGFGIAFVCVSPIYLGFLLLGSFNIDTPFKLLLHKCISPGFMEELVFRAFMFGLLFRYAKTGFLWAVILPAIYFGAIHLYQGDDAISAFAAFGVTFIGAIYFSWMYVEWDFNIWIPVGLHILMNAAWVLFTLDGTEVAAGGLISNILRIVSILLAIGITIWYKKHSCTPVKSSYPIWQF